MTMSGFSDKVRHLWKKSLTGVEKASSSLYHNTKFKVSELNLLEQHLAAEYGLRGVTVEADWPREEGKPEKKAAGGKVLQLVYHDVNHDRHVHIPFEEQVRCICEYGGRCITYRELEQYIDPIKAYDYVVSA